MNRYEFSHEPTLFAGESLNFTLTGVHLLCGSQLLAVLFDLFPDGLRRFVCLLEDRSGLLFLRRSEIENLCHVLQVHVPAHETTLSFFGASATPDWSRAWRLRENDSSSQCGLCGVLDECMSHGFSPPSLQ